MARQGKPIETTTRLLVIGAILPFELRLAADARLRYEPRPMLSMPMRSAESNLMSVANNPAIKIRPDTYSGCVLRMASLASSGGTPRHGLGTPEGNPRRCWTEGSEAWQILIVRSLQWFRPPGTGEIQ